MDFISIRSQNRFVGISAFVYAMDFARWVLELKLPGANSRFVDEFPSPSKDAMRYASDAICSLPLLEPLYAQHPFTSEREAKGRCFDVCYITEIIALIFSNDSDDRLVDFLIEVGPAYIFCFLHL